MGSCCNSLKLFCIFENCHNKMLRGQSPTVQRAIGSFLNHALAAKEALVFSWSWHHMLVATIQI